MRIGVSVVLVVIACGSAQTSLSLAPPPPPTAALAAWAGFPANSNPRPIVSFGVTAEHIPQAGFPTDDRKIAWICSKFALANGVTLGTTRPGPATAGGASYPSISSANAYADLMAARSQGGKPTDCAKAQPFVITGVRWATAGFPTDRGTMRMSAWLFDVPEVGSYIGYSAVDPTSFWGGMVMADAGGRGGRISADGVTLKIPVANAEPGPCGADYTASAAESQSAVAIAVKRYPHSPPDQPVACDLMLRISYVSVTLKSPLGGRVLVDENSKVGSVCPDQGDC